MSFWLKTAGAIALTWIVAAGIIHFARASKPTAQSIADYIGREDINTKSGTQRARVIGRVEDMLNRISFDERQQLQRQGVTRDFVRKLTPDEQSAFLDATLPAGFKQWMESFNKMEPERRKRIVDRALAEMKKHEGEQQPRRADDKLTQKIVDQGLRSFYSDASADVKLDMAPLIEQMQKNLQSGGGGGGPGR
jgi:hypothetical protein